MSHAGSSSLRLAALIALLAVSVGAAADSRIQVEASLEPHTIGVDETARLTIRASGSGFGGVDIEPSFQLENLDVVAGPFESQQFQFTNGRTSRSRSLSWELKPREVGPAAVRALRVKVDGQTMTLPDQRLTVQDQPTRSAPPSSAPGIGFPDPFAQMFGRAPTLSPAPMPREGSPRVFLRADIDPANPYVGQQSTYTLYLFTQTSIGGINPESLPDFHGFWVHEIPQPDPPASSMVELEGRSYRKVVLIQRALFPLSSGRQTIDAAKAELQVQLPGSSPFGGLFPQIQRIERESNRLAIQVQPLPAEPSGFSGAVGEFHLTARLDPRTVQAGDAATLVIRLQGAGHLQGLQAPRIQPPEGVEVFAPQGETHENIKNGRVEGERVWSYPVVAKRPGTWSLRVPAFTYFDPADDRFQTSPVQDLALIATPARASAPAEAPARDGAPPAKPVRPANSLLHRARPLITWLAGGVVLVLGLTIWLLARPRFGSGRGKNDRSDGFEAKVQSLAQLHKPRDVARELEARWREWLTESADLPGNLEPERWSDHLRQRGVDFADCERMRHIAADLHYLRYAPELAAVDTLRDDLIERSRALARHLSH